MTRQHLPLLFIALFTCLHLGCLDGVTCDGNDDNCEKNEFCDITATGFSCEGRKGERQACGRHRECAEQNYCFKQCYARRGFGEGCTSHEQCQAEFQCGDERKCVPRFKQGEMCNRIGTCEASLFCVKCNFGDCGGEDILGTCQPQRKSGESCRGDHYCGPGLSCDTSVCKTK